MADGEPTEAKKIPIVGFFIKHRNALSWCLLIALVAGIWVYRSMNTRKFERAVEYVEAENTLSALQQGQLQAEEASTALAGILEKHGELQQKYSAPLAQALLRAGEVEQAGEHMESTFARAGEELTPFKEFGEVTLLVAQEDYEKALQKSAELQEHLPDHLSYLRVMNCLRIALLSSEVGDVDREKSAWQQLITLLGDPNCEEVSGQVREDLSHLFQNGQSSLLDYAKARYSQL